MLGLAHGPEQCCRLLGRKQFSNAFELYARNSTDTLNLFRIPLVNFLACFVKTINTLLDEFLVFPTVFEDVPHHPHQHRNVGTGTNADIFIRVRSGTRQSRIDDDEVRLVELFAFEHVLQ